MNKTHSKKEFPVRVENENHSVDVITIDECDLINIGFYHFVDEKWYFHTDTLLNYDEEGNETDFKWIYQPDYLIYE